MNLFLALTLYKYAKFWFYLYSFQVEGFLRAMQKQMQSSGKRGLFSKRPTGPQSREKFTFEDMLCFQKVHYLV